MLLPLPLHFPGHVQGGHTFRASMRARCPFPLQSLGLKMLHLALPEIVVFSFALLGSFQAVYMGS